MKRAHCRGWAYGWQPQAVVCEFCRNGTETWKSGSLFGTLPHRLSGRPTSTEVGTGAVTWGVSLKQGTFHFGESWFSLPLRRFSLYYDWIVFWKRALGSGPNYGIYESFARCGLVCCSVRISRWVLDLCGFYECSARCMGLVSSLVLCVFDFLFGCLHWKLIWVFGLSSGEVLPTEISNDFEGLDDEDWMNLTRTNGESGQRNKRDERKKKDSIFSKILLK